MIVSVAHAGPRVVDNVQGGEVAVAQAGEEAVSVVQVTGGVVVAQAVEITVVFTQTGEVAVSVVQAGK